MNLRTTMTAAVALLFLISFSGVAAAANDEQSGTNSTCVDYNVLWAVEGVEVGEGIPVDAGTGFEVSSDTGDPVLVDFYNVFGAWLSSNDGAATGTVPGAAAYAIVCVGLTGGFPDAPNPTSTWTYQDGF